MWAVTTVLMLASMLTLSRSNSNMGPFNLLFTSVGRCPKGLNGKDSLFYSLKMQRVSRKSLVMHANASFTDSINDEQTILVNLAKHTNQGWKDNFFITELKKACSTLFKYLPQLYETLPGNLKKKPCPLPPGNYTVALDLSITPPPFLPQFQYGKYRARAFIRRSPETYFCAEAVVDLVPKKSG